MNLNEGPRALRCIPAKAQSSDGTEVLADAARLWRFRRRLPADNAPTEATSRRSGNAPEQEGMQVSNWHDQRQQKA